MSDTCRQYALLMMLLPVVSAISVSHHAAKRGFAWCVMVGALLYHLFNFGTVLILGTAGALTVQNFRCAMWAYAGIAGLAAIVRLPSLVRAVVGIRYRPSIVDLPLAAAAWLVARLLCHDARFNWTEGPTLFDAMNYHIPRALQWIWHGSIEPYRTSIWQQVGHAYGGTASAVTPVFYGCGWLGSAFNTEVYSIGAAAAVFVSARALGLSGRGAWAAALAFMSFPAVGLRLADVSTDIAASFPVLAGTALFLARDSLAQGAFRFVALVGLGTACKQYVAFPAVPIAVMLFAPHVRELLSRRCLTAIAAAGLVGITMCALSFYPIYRLFGSFTGGSSATGLTTFGVGIPGMIDALQSTFISWLFEPLGGLPDQQRAAVFYGLHVADLFRMFFIDTDPNGPRLDHEHVRSGILPVIFLPWLLLGVKRGHRMFALLGFLAICLFQFSPLARNHVGARFAIIPLAAFALLWGARASRSALSGVLVACCVVVALWCDHRYLTGWHAWTDSYNPDKEDNLDVATAVKSDTILVLSSELSTHAFIAGRLGNVRFEYFNCPPDGEWVKALTEAKAGYRWFLFSRISKQTVPGPTYQTTLGEPCSSISLDDLRAWLTTAGWSPALTTASHNELWTAQ